MYFTVLGPNKKEAMLQLQGRKSNAMYDYKWCEYQFFSEMQIRK